MNYCSEILLVPSSSNAKSLQLSGSMCLTRMAVGKAPGVRGPRSGSHPQPQTHWQPGMRQGSPPNLSCLLRKVGEPGPLSCPSEVWGYPFDLVTRTPASRSLGGRKRRGARGTSVGFTTAPGTIPL